MMWHGLLRIISNRMNLVSVASVHSSELGFRFLNFRQLHPTCKASLSGFAVRSESVSSLLY